MQDHSAFLIWGKYTSSLTGQMLCGKKGNTVRCKCNNNDDSSNGRSNNFRNSDSGQSKSDSKPRNSGLSNNSSKSGNSSPDQPGKRAWMTVGKRGTSTMSAGTNACPNRSVENNPTQIF